MKSVNLCDLVEFLQQLPADTHVFMTVADVPKNLDGRFITLADVHEVMLAGRRAA